MVMSSLKKPKEDPQWTLG